MNILQFAHVWDSTLRVAEGGYACVGGVVTSALLEPSTVIDVEKQRIIVDPGFAVSGVRPDGTIRDIDLIVFTTDKEEVGNYSQQLRRQLAVAVGEEGVVPEVSAAGYETSRLDTEPWLQFVSQFVLLDKRVYLKLGHVVQEIPRSSQEDTWELVWGDSAFLVLHPLAHLCSYLTRSVTGVRPKDSKNVQLLRLRLLTIFPLEEWQKYGAWMQFAHAVSFETSLSRALSSRNPRRIVLALGRCVLGLSEKMPWFVRLARQPGGIVRRVASWGLRYSRPSIWEV